MDLEIRTEIDRQHSVDPSYIVRYQVFEGGRFIGDGVVQYHRQAAHNDYHIPDTIRRVDGSPLDGEFKEKIKRELSAAAARHINTRQK